MTTHEPAIFAHDDRTLFYPTAPGRVFAITFDNLAAYNGDDAHFAAGTEKTDLHGMTTTTGLDGSDVHVLQPAPLAFVLVLIGRFP